jgi:tRNA threonylcarbamoyladenosine biosynthesis protein TsaE
LNTPITFDWSTPEATARAAAHLASLLKPGHFVALDGELGAGKTTFVQGLCRALEVRDVVSSPTFVLLRIYKARLPVYHFDVYRLEHPDQVWELGADELFWGDGVCLVEWASTLGEHLPTDRLELYLSRPTVPAPQQDGFAPEESTARICTAQAQGEVHQRLLRHWASSLGAPLQ